MIPIRDTIPSRSAPVVTWALIAVNATVFLCELQFAPEQLEQFFYLFGMVPARYSHPEWARSIGFPIDDYWPFLTSMFLHGGWLHLIANMWTLWLFGKAVEDRMGRMRFLLFYLLAGVAAGLTHWFTNVDSTMPAVGASGAIAGVLGAYFILYPRARIIVIHLYRFLVSEPGVRRHAERPRAGRCRRRSLVGARRRLPRRRCVVSAISAPARTCTAQIRAG